MNTRHLFTLLCLWSSLALEAQQIDLSGRVSIHNSRYRTGQIEYVSDAFVSAPFAGSTSSDEEGRFGLTFSGIENGTVIKLTVEKAGLEVVNSYDLERVILGQKPDLPIYLAPKGRLAEAQTELYNISREALFAKKEALIIQLLGEREESQHVIHELEGSVGRTFPDVAIAIQFLEDRVEQLEKRLPTFALELASVNLDFASNLYLEAYEYYRSGEIELAINTLDEIKLEEAFQSAIRTIEEGVVLSNLGDELQQQGQLQVNQIIESYELKAESFALLFNYEKASMNQEEVIRILEQTDSQESLVFAEANEKLGQFLLNAGDFQKSILALNRGATIKERILADTDVSLSNTYNLLALVYQATGQYDEALDNQEKALLIRERALGTDDVYVAQSYNNLATIHRDLGNYLAALDAQEKAIEIQERVLASDHPELVPSFNNLALINLALGDYNAALEAQEKAVVIASISLDPNHPRLAIAYNNLGAIYRDLGEYEYAIDATQKALVIQEQNLGENHPSLASSYNNLSLTYKEIGELDLALQAQEQSFAILSQVSAPNQADIATSYSNFAAIYYIKKDYQAALIAQEKAIEIQEKVLDKFHPSFAYSYNNLATIYLGLEEYKLALDAQIKAIEIQGEIYQHDHPNVAMSYNNLGMVLIELGMYDSAKHVMQKAINIQEQMLGFMHPNVALSYHNLSAAYYSQELIDSALICEEKAILIWTNQLPTNHPNLHAAKWNFTYLLHWAAIVEMSHRRFTEARVKLRKGLEFYENISTTYFLLGVCNFYDEEFEKAIEYLSLSYEADAEKLTLCLEYLVYAYMMTNQIERAEYTFNQLETIIENPVLIFRRLILYYVDTEDIEKALVSLEQAAQIGYTDKNWLQTEEALAPLRELPRFQELLDRIPDE